MNEIAVNDLVCWVPKNQGEAPVYALTLHGLVSWLYVLPVEFQFGWLLLHAVGAVCRKHFFDHLFNTFLPSLLLLRVLMRELGI